MSLSKTQWALLGINIISVLGFSWYYLQALNYEFVAYALSIVVIIGVLFGTLRWTQFSTSILAGITLWGILHMMGGSVMTPDGVLYTYRIFPFFDGGGDFYVLKMDQAIHAFLYGVVGLMFYQAMVKNIGITTHRLLVVFIAIFAAAGFGIINEIIEFWAAMNIEGNGVGGYENTVLDLIFNLSGAAIAVISYHLWQGRKKQ